MSISVGHDIEIAALLLSSSRGFMSISVGHDDGMAALHLPAS